MSNELNSIAIAIKKLEENGEEECAEDLRELMAKKTGRIAKVSSYVRSLLGATIGIGLAAVGIAAFLESAYMGAYTRALLILVYILLMYVLMAIFSHYTSGIRDWFATDVMKQ